MIIKIQIMIQTDFVAPQLQVEDVAQISEKLVKDEYGLDDVNTIKS